MKNWFEGVRTLEELKKAYRTLAIKHHPDKGGRTEDMQEINAQYDMLAAKLPATNAKGETYQPAPEKREAPEEFRASVMAAINLDGVDRVFVRGGTRPAQNINQATFANHRPAWYHDSES